MVKIAENKVENCLKSECDQIDPDYIYEAIQNRLDELERVLNQVRNRKNRAPEGTLRIVQKGEYLQYYHRKEAKDTRGSYLKKQESELAHQLAQKDYDQKLIHELEQEITVLSKCLKNYHPEEIDHIYRKLHPLRKSLVRPILQSDREYAAEWKKVSYKSKEIKEKNGEYYSDAGEQVRSKSEIIIANKLLKLGIPYRYEYPILFTSGVLVHPDFYCLNMRTRKEIAWEHFGMMDNAEYAEKAVRKIGEYQKNGYWFGRNLIATFETSLKPLSVMQLEKVIQEYLL